MLVTVVELHLVLAGRLVVADYGAAVPPVVRKTDLHAHALELGVGDGEVAEAAQLGLRGNQGVLLRSSGAARLLRQRDAVPYRAQVVPLPVVVLLVAHLVEARGLVEGLDGPDEPGVLAVRDLDLLADELAALEIHRTEPAAALARKIRLRHLVARAREIQGMPLAVLEGDVAHLRGLVVRHD